MVRQTFSFQVARLKQICCAKVRRSGRRSSARAQSASQAVAASGNYVFYDDWLKKDGIQMIKNGIRENVSCHDRNRRRNKHRSFSMSSNNSDSDAEEPVARKRLSKKEAEEAAKKALIQAMGGKRDRLKKFDNGGGNGGFFNFSRTGGGGGDGGDDGGRGTLQVLFLIACAVFTFYAIKPACALVVNLIYYVFKIPTGWPGDEEPVDPREIIGQSTTGMADADIISKYGMDDDDDDDDDE
jgi:hypothetical protein